MTFAVLFSPNLRSDSSMPTVMSINPPHPPQNRRKTPKAIRNKPKTTPTLILLHAFKII
ncbi:hypothetical protein [Archaeoglobus sp.]